MNRTKGLIGAGIVGFLILAFVVYKVMEKFGLIKSEEAKKLEADNVEASSTQTTPWAPQYYKTRPKGTVIKLITKATANQFADQIFESIGNFYDDENGVYSIFRQLTYKSQLSFLSEVFNTRHKADLYNFLQRNFSDKEITVLINIVSNLK